MAVLLACAFLVAGCTPATSKDNPVFQHIDSASVATVESPYVRAEDLNPAEALAKAQKDTAAGRCILYVVSNVGPYVPGSPMSFTEATESYDVLIVTGTSDAPKDYKSDANAKIFAKIYNDIVLAKCGDRK